MLKYNARTGNHDPGVGWSISCAVYQIGILWNIWWRSHCFKESSTDGCNAGDTISYRIKTGNETGN